MTSIPFEEQQNYNGQRTCGAAALNMIYKSFGTTLPQQAIWQVISVPDAYGGRFARTYRLALDAMLRGFSAIAFKAQDPIRAVKQVLASGASVIMNHRLKEDTGLGHYTVALSADDDQIVLHDPEFGPEQKRSTCLMRELWQPKSDPREIEGNFLIALAKSATSRPKCSVCGSLSPASVLCPGCFLTIPLQPSIALGCCNIKCTTRQWEGILCPFCDCVFPLS